MRQTWIGAAVAVLAEITVMGGAVAAGPDDQAKFCQIIDDAFAAWSALDNRVWREQNGVKRMQMEAELNRIEEDRNVSLYQLLGSELRIENWSVTVTSIRPYLNNTVVLHGSFGCRVQATFEGGPWRSPEVLNVLANKSEGDRLKVTATFKIPHSYNTRVQKELDCGGPTREQQKYSMEHPEYVLEVDRLDDVPVSDADKGLSRLWP